MVQEVAPLLVFDSAYNFQPGNLVWVKSVALTWSLEPLWKGPYPMVLTTHTEVMIYGAIL